MKSGTGQLKRATPNMEHPNIISKKVNFGKGPSRIGTIWKNTSEKKHLDSGNYEQ